MNRILNKIRNFVLCRRELSKIGVLLSNNIGKKKFFIFQTPTHSNIGDQAIAVAEINFLKKYFSNDLIVEVNQSIMIDFLRKYKKLVSKTDSILLHGGGNFGDEYIIEENLRRRIVEEFPNNKIIVFPQTIHYSDSDVGRKNLSKTQELFSKHNNLVLTARESVSFEEMKKFFPKNKVILTPDIVLSMNRLKFNTKRTYALGVIRNDQESILDDNMKKHINKLLTSNFKEVIYSDMHNDNYGSIYTSLHRDKVLDSKFLQFSKAKIVITDRLHGMVFCAITSTPCIVFSNYNQKVLGTYQWIKSLPYIKFVKTTNELELAFSELVRIENSEFIELNSVVYQPLIEELDDKNR